MIKARLEREEDRKSLIELCIERGIPVYQADKHSLVFL
jgi:hypothetical protein